jgi:hypothetical protein
VTGNWLHTAKGLYNNPTLRLVALTLYYLAIILGLIIMYGKGDFSTPPFIYQQF